MKELAIAYPSPTLIYGHIINPLLIVLSRDYTKDWFFDNFIQLCAPKDVFIYEEKDVEFLNFFPKYLCDTSYYLRSYNLTDEIMHIFPENICELLIRWIDNDFYIQLYLDEGGIPGTHASLHNNHLLNEQLIYGYDDRACEFMFTSFDENMHHKKMKIKFDDVRRIFGSQIYKSLSRECKWPCIGNEYGITLLRFNENVRFNPNPKHICEQLVEYYNGENSARHFLWFTDEKLQYNFGMDIYESIISWLALHKNGEHIDIRVFYGLWDHKKIMIQRIDYLIQIKAIPNNGSIISQFNQVEKLSNTIRTVALKYNLSHKENSIISLIRLIEELRNAEKAALKELIDAF